MWLRTCLDELNFNIQPTHCARDLKRFTFLLCRILDLLEEALVDFHIITPACLFALKVDMFRTDSSSTPFNYSQ